MMVNYKVCVRHGGGAMKQVNLSEAKSQLSNLVDRAAKGESFVIAKSGTPLARLMPLYPEPARHGITLGLMDGDIEVADGFDDPLPDWLLAAFEGEPLEGEPV